MKRLNEIMEDLGFRKDAPESVKEAFLKNLIKQAERKKTFTVPPTKEGAAPADGIVSTARNAVGEDAKDGVGAVKSALQDVERMRSGPTQLSFELDFGGISAAVGRTAAKVKVG